jgi:hypothetical protein
VIDQAGRCSDPAYWAAGNLLRPVETAGWCWSEGMRVGRNVARDLAGALPKAEGEISISAGTGVKFVVPQRLAAGVREQGQLQLRVSRPINGRLTLSGAGMAPVARRISGLPERRVLFSLADVALPAQGNITIDIEER